jgi:hypothetical protein
LFLFEFIITIKIFSSSIESFIKADPSGRVQYSSLPAIIERFGITLTENDVVSAAKDLEYNGKKFSGKE